MISYIQPTISYNNADGELGVWEKVATFVPERNNF